MSLNLPLSGSFVIAVVKDSLVLALPPVSVVGGAVNAIRHIFAKSLHDDPIDDAEAEDFLFNGTEIQASRIAKIYCERRIQGYQTISPETDLKKEMLEKFLSQRILAYGRLIVDFDKNLSLSIRIPRQTTKETSCSKFQAIGSDVILLSSLPGTMPEMQELKNLNPELSEDQKFCIAHEFTHLKNKDTFKAVALSIGFTVLSLFPWVRAVRTGVTISSLLAAYGGSFLIQAIGKVFRTSVQRNQELAADRGAVHLLKSNLGAINFFSSLKENPQDFCHPLPSKRLNQAKSCSLQS